MDPQGERRVAQFNGARQHVIQRQEDWHLDNQRQTTSQRVHFLSFIQRHHLLAHALFVITNTFTHRGQFRLQHTHFGHRRVLSAGQWVHDTADNKGDDDDGEAPVTDEAVDKLQQFEQRLRDEPQPAVVYGQVKVWRDSGHFVLNFRANPQGRSNLLLRTWLNNKRRAFKADGRDTVVGGGVEVVGIVR